MFPITALSNVFEKQIKVKTRKFPKIVLGIPGELGMTPKSLVANLQTAKKEIDSVAETKSEDIFFNQPFGLPLLNNRKISSRFGEIRKTGNEEIRHLNKIKAKENDSIKKGTIIGTVGKTGYATSPHFHLSVKINGVSVDPLRFVSVFK